MTENNEGAGARANTVMDTAPAKPARKPRKPAAKKKQPPLQGRKTLYAASGALAFAAADFLISLRYPDVPGACQVLRNMF